MTDAPAGANQGKDMASFNKAQVIGFLGNDPEVRYSQAGAAITTISVATTEKWTDKNGDQQEETEWHRITFFGRMAEIAGEYLKKGAQVFVEGRIKTDHYTDKDGVERWSTKIIGQELKMLDRKPQGEGGGQRQERPASGGPRSGGSAPPQRQQPPQRNEDPFPDDDIPF
jgi:single-strand DNA-binding protein